MKFDSKNGNNGLNEAKIVNVATMVTVLGGGELDSADLDAVLTRAPVLVAADGGADAALAAGLMPDAVIGDLDSLTDAARARIDARRIHEISEQNSTDFDKALRSISAPLVLAVGCSGARIDHELAAYHVLIAGKGPRCILVGSHDIVFAAPPRLRLELTACARVSLFPMAPVTGRSEGLRWPIDALAFAPDARIGTSNEATDGVVRLEFDSAGMLIILPKRFLDAAITGLTEITMAPADPKV